MINFKELGDGTVLAIQDNNDGSTRVIAKVEASHTHPKKSPDSFTSWEVIDDKLNSLRKIPVAQALALAWTAINHVAVIKDILRRDDNKPD